MTDSQIDRYQDIRYPSTINKYASLSKYRSSLLLKICKQQMARYFPSMSQRYHLATTHRISSNFILTLAIIPDLHFDFTCAISIGFIASFTAFAITLSFLLIAVLLTVIKLSQ